MATLVFTYGTLRVGERNFTRYLDHEGARLVAKGVYTWPEFGLVSLGGYPGMLVPDEQNADVKTAVVGDVFEVDSPTLRALDRLEGVPHHYQRQYVRLANGMDVQAYVVNPQRVPDGAAVIKHGDWLRFVRENPRHVSAGGQ